MNLLCVLLALAISVAECSWYDSFVNFYLNVMGDPCPGKVEMLDRIFSLETQLKRRVIGQPFVHKTFYSIVKNHLETEPQKPLVISMHGWTGSGKNYVTQILIETLYDRGFDNSNVHFFSGRLHFPLATKTAVDEYKVSLHNWIRGNVTRCPMSVFVFDEIDKVPVDVVDAIKPYLDYHSSLDRVDFRKAIFVFISNVGGNVITRRYVELWESGISRDKMEYKSYEAHLRKVLYNTEGSFEKSSILEDHLVSLYLPFLPMEKEHVTLCIKQEMLYRNVKITQESIDYVLNALEFYNDRFSISGCKRVSDQVAMLKYQGRDEF